MNYFNYFTEIEMRFQQRRGSLLMLSTLDWALIETWREAGVPLDAVLRGIDAAFDKQAAQTQRSTRRPRKVNGLAWCAQAVLEAVEQSKDAAIGAQSEADSKPQRESGFESDRIARYLERNAALLSAANLPAPANAAASVTAIRLRELAADLSLLSSRSVAEGSAFPSLDSAPLNLEALAYRSRREALRRAADRCARRSTRRVARTGCARIGSLSRQDAGRADQTGAAAIPTKAPARSSFAASPRPLLHAAGVTPLTAQTSPRIADRKTPLATAQTHPTNEPPHRQPNPQLRRPRRS